MNEVTIPSRVDVQFPWFEMIQAFIDDAPRRQQLLRDCVSMPPSTEMSELRVMTLGGPRQCGKTEALFKIIKGRDDVRFSIKSIFIPYYKARLGNDYLGKLFPIDLFEVSKFDEEIRNGINPFQNVRVLVTDNLDAHIQKDLKEIYSLYKEYFHPDFMVVHVIH
jgi:hypothetical protein